MQLFDVYPRFGIELVSGKGAFVFDCEGTKYLDLYGGHGVISIGHAHPRYVEGITQQLNRLGFYSNSVLMPLQDQLAERLSALSGYEDYRLFLVNSGAEANENAIRLASFHTGRPRIAAFRRSFHGRTGGAIAVTDNIKIRASFNDTDHTVFLELNDPEALRKTFRNNPVCAVIVEGIQGVAGVHLPDDLFMQNIRKLCDESGAVMIVDEVQSGYGRSGRFFAHQYAGVRPDLITIAKGMGNGFPIGGVLIHPRFEAWHGMLGTTFGGNHLACAAGIAVLEVIEAENLIENAARIGAYLLDHLRGLSNKIKAVRGRGLMIGIEFENNIVMLRKNLLSKHHILTGMSGTHTLRLLPMLGLGTAHADRFLEALSEEIDYSIGA